MATRIRLRVMTNSDDAFVAWAGTAPRPLVVTDVPGCRYFVRDGIEGFVVPPDDPMALAKALDRLAGDRELRRTMGAAARRRLLEGFTEADVMLEVVGAYHALSSRMG